ncbi:MAG: PhzF family phenazine biosynthesis protein [Oscillospiraceae bacterium]|nr:PhzF family phenazine biosynthesis protein [Oscillospiraceae bacterium]
MDGLLLHITAKGSSPFDCVSRSFGPKLQIPEDPVCGSGHCHIFPYWADRLKKDRLVGYQTSERGGTVYGTMRGERVVLGGEAVMIG